ncbi:uncharacterized protein LOC106012130, partial [Aplysia californica]|uniref:Uncharacterized protein LOC106012130 n=1 Tax=Aplysia californica TaxID=6500 RepID=A0ABM1A2H4_APLCA
MTSLLGSSFCQAMMMMTMKRERSAAILGLVFVCLTAVLPGSRGADVDVQAELQELRDMIRTLTKLTMVQQEFIEERIRSDGQSGIKQLRHDTEGTRTYYGSTHIDYSTAAIHDHSDYVRAVGMGETIAVMNGVEFRTRHNDYRLVRASTTSNDFLATEDLDFPPVPPEVTDKDSVQEQIAELREWFLAFHNQNDSHRNYHDYFRPVLCYMEGMWINDTDSEMTEPFPSDRHFLDASSWEDLMTKVRYMAYTGLKDNLENLAFLPRKIMSVSDDGHPHIAQWLYRILCHPIQGDLPTRYLRQREDWSYSYPRGRNQKSVLASRGARFQISEFEEDKFTDFSLLDELMQGIPGVDNTPSASLARGYAGDLYPGNSSGQEHTLQEGFYHRWYKFARKGAMGSAFAHVGFSDEPLFMAVTSQERVVPLAAESCNNNGRQCVSHSTRVTYAMPLEVIYLTPLLSWNPYNISYNETAGTSRQDSRDGSTDSLAFLGSDSETYYRTPVDFFSGGSVEADVADTVRATVKVLDSQNVVRDVTASGTRVILPAIEGQEIRLRYPVPPIHMEGSSVWKEVNVIKDYLTENGGDDDGDGD